jgi:endonuclease YncB( thermonuclease family)
MSKPPSKPAASAAAPAKGAKPAASAKAAEKAKPDAALLDREVDEGAEEIVAPATTRTGFRRLLPASKLGWTIAASVLVTVIGGAATAAIFLMPPKATPALSNIAGPAQVVNGRMLVVAGQTIRLQAIDAPPAELVCRDGVWEYKCGADSRKALEQLVANRPVDCEPTHTADGVVHALCRSEQGVDVAAALVASGWAVADLRRSSRYFPQQTKAQDQGLGLWRNNFAHPEQWRLAAQGTR